MCSNQEHFQLQKHYLEACKQPDNAICLEYVWIDGTKEKLRSKSRVVNKVPKVVEDCPEWNFDGSSTGQAHESNTDIYLKPVAMFLDPFMGGENRLVLCETMLFDRTPIPSNSRNSCAQVMKEAEAPWRRAPTKVRGSG